jgi:HEAT repeat protein
MKMGILNKFISSLTQKSRIEKELNEPAKAVAIALKSWYRNEAKKWWQTSARKEAVCDDGNERLTYGEGYFRPAGGYLSCEHCIETLLCSQPWDEALMNIEHWFGPGVPRDIQELARKVAPQSISKRSQIQDIEIFDKLPNIEKRKARRDVKGLIEALSHKEWRIRRDAAIALGELVDPSAVNPLTAAIFDNDYNVKKSAAAALVKFGAVAVKPFIDALENNDVIVRRLAVEALGKLQDKRAVEPLINTLIKPIDIPEFKTGRESVCRDAVAALVKIGDARAVEPLITILRDKNEILHLDAVKALGELGDTRAVEPLIDILKYKDILTDTKKDFREAAAEALGKIGDLRAVEPLIVALADNYWSVRSNSARSLGKLKDPRAILPLITALNDRDESVRFAAAKSLGALGDSQAIEPLIAALKDKDELVREIAEQSLERIGGPVAERALEEYRNQHQ